MPTRQRLPIGLPSKFNLKQPNGGGDQAVLSGVVDRGESNLLSTHQNHTEKPPEKEYKRPTKQKEEEIARDSPSGHGHPFSTAVLGIDTWHWQSMVPSVLGQRTTEEHTWAEDKGEAYSGETGGAWRTPGMTPRLVDQDSL